MERHYRIQAVSNMVGISPGTLRAWEKRYQVVVPKRSDKGQRVYTESDVATLQRLKTMSERGISLQDAAREILLESTLDLSPEKHPSTPEDPFARVREELRAACLDLDRSKAEQVLRSVLPLYPFEEVFKRLLASVLRSFEGTDPDLVAAEHFATALFREKIISMIGALPGEIRTPRRVLLAAPVGEWHELGLLFLHLWLSRRGWSVTYLGVNTPVAALQEAVRKVSPRLVCLSATDHLATETLLQSVRALASFPDLSVVVGGGISACHKNALKAEGALLVADERELEGLLEV